MGALPGLVSAGVPPIADFTANETSVCLNEVIQFNDTSIYSPTSWFWLFGDSQDSHDQNPTHYYDVTGSFTVSLNATNAFGSDIQEEKAYITVTDCAGNPDFSANVTCQIGAPMPILFTGHCPFPGAKNHWDWGDGNVTEDLQSPEYTYNDYGVYSVSHSCKYTGYDTVYENKTDYIVLGVNGTVCEDSCNMANYEVQGPSWITYASPFLFAGFGLGLIIFSRRRRKDNDLD